MTTLASVDESADLADGTYSISTPEEMKKLADMTNAGLVSAGDEFVLANDIDLSQYENWTPIGEIWYRNDWVGHWFKGTFDGNGFVIKNITSKPTGKDDTASLFGGLNVTAEVKNLGIIASVFEGAYAASLARTVYYSSVVNVYASNCSIISTAANAGGLLIELYNSNLLDSYTLSNNIIGFEASGLVYQNGWNSSIENCFSENEISGLTNSAGFVAVLSGNQLKIKNCYVFGNSNLSGIFTGRPQGGSTSAYATIENSGYSSYYLGKPLVGSSNGLDIIANVNVFNTSVEKKIDLQVGIDASSASQIGLNTSFFKDSISLFRVLGLIDGDYLTPCDRLLDKLSEKQTYFGAVSNRLESVLEEITIQRDNLVSSRSTIRDADIAEVSSHYIQQQILQQASATLLATANQSPSIALQLI